MDMPSPSCLRYPRQLAAIKDSFALLRMNRKQTTNGDNNINKPERRIGLDTLNRVNFIEAPPFRILLWFRLLYYRHFDHFRMPICEAKSISVNTSRRIGNTDTSGCMGIPAQIVRVVEQKRLGRL